MQKARPAKRIAQDFKTLHHQPHRHWHYVYRQRKARKFVDEVSTVQIITGQLFTVLASVGAGYILDMQKGNLALVIGTFVLMPGIVDLSASLTGAMAAKINHHIDETPAHPFTIALHSVLFSLFVGTFAGLIIGVFGGLLSYILLDGDVVQIVKLGLLSMISISVIGNPIIAFMTIGFKKLGLNPDNIVGPIQSSIIDVLAILIIAGYARILS